jgi:hypothetical protein
MEGWLVARIGTVFGWESEWTNGVRVGLTNGLTNPWFVARIATSSRLIREEARSA